MKVIKAIPLEEVDDIKFGTDREIVREKIESFSKFMKTPYFDNTPDDF